MNEITIVEVLAVIGAVSTAARALQQVAIELEKVAAKTESAQDDRIMARVVSVLGAISRGLNRVSIGATPQGRDKPE